MASRAVPSLLQQLSPGLFLLAVRAKPGAKSTKVVGPVDATIQQVEVRVGARPVDGQANSELVEHLEQLLQSWVVRSSEELDRTETCGGGSDHLTSASVSRTKGAGKKKSGHDESKQAHAPLPRKVVVELVAGSTSRDKMVRVAFPGSGEQLLSVLKEDAE